MRKFKVIVGGKSVFDKEIIKMRKQLSDAFDTGSENLLFTLISSTGQLAGEADIPYEEAQAIAMKELSLIAAKKKRSR